MFKGIVHPPKKSFTHLNFYSKLSSAEHNFLIYFLMVYAHQKQSKSLHHVIALDYLPNVFFFFFCHITCPFSDTIGCVNKLFTCVSTRHANFPLELILFSTWAEDAIQVYIMLLLQLCLPVCHSLCPSWICARSCLCIVFVFNVLTVIIKFALALHTP